MYTTRIVDQSIAQMEIRDGGRGVQLILEDRGEIALPIHLALTLEGGEVVEIRAGHDQWQDGRMVIDRELPAPVVTATLDPDQMLPDLDRTNNSWTPGM